MNSQTILDQAKELGITLSVKGERLIFSPRSLASAEFVQGLRDHKQELLAFFAQRPGSEQDSPAYNRPNSLDFESNEALEFDPAPTEAELRLAAISTWAGPDAKRWNRVLKHLKRHWRPATWIPDSPRDLLVAWAAANFRLVSAQQAQGKLGRISHPTQRLRAVLNARKADISFFSRLAKELAPRAASALADDAEAIRLLQGVCQGDSAGSQS